MAKSRYDAILNFSKNYLNYLNHLNYLELSRVTLSTCNTQENFCFVWEPFSHKNQISVVALLNYLIKCNYRFHKTNRSYMHIFSMGLGNKLCLEWSWFSWRRPLSHSNQSIDLIWFDWFLYDKDLRHESVKANKS